MMAVWIQDRIIQSILQPMANFMNRFSDRKKELIFTLSGMMLFLMYFLYSYGSGSGMFTLRYLIVFCFGCAMTGLMILCSMPNKLSSVKVDWFVCAPAFGFGVMALIAGLTKDTNHLSQAILALVVFPVAYLVWINGDFFKVVELLMRSSRWAFIFFLVIHLLFYPVIGRRFSGIFYNTNGMAFYLTIVLCCLMIEIAATKDVGSCIINSVFFGIAGAYLFYTSSRTGLLSVAAATAVFMGTLLLSDRKSFVQFCIRRLPMILICLLMFIPLLISISHVTVQCQKTLSDWMVSVEDKVHEDIADEKIRSTEEILHEISQNNKTRLSKGDKTLLRYSSGRLDIWKGYLNNITFWGHSYSDKFEFVREGEVGENGTAHNTIIQYAYNFGALAGVFYMLFNLMSGVKSVTYAFRNKTNVYAFAPLIITIAFGLTSVLASMGSFSYMIGYYYYLVQAPLVVRWNKQNYRNNV